MNKKIMILSALFACSVLSVFIADALWRDRYYNEDPGFVYYDAPDYPAGPVAGLVGTAAGVAEGAVETAADIATLGGRGYYYDDPYYGDRGWRGDRDEYGVRRGHITGRPKFFQ